MPSKERNKYKGTLNKPIRVPTYKEKRKTYSERVSDTSPQDDAERKAHTQNNAFRYSAELLEKMPVLFAHYGIADSPDKWILLAFRLAADHVPGFSLEPEKNRGRKLETDDKFLLQLYLDVQRKSAPKHGRTPSVAQICTALIRGNSFYKDYASKTLQNLHTQSQSSAFVRIYEYMIANGSNEAELNGLFGIN